MSLQQNYNTGVLDLQATLFLFVLKCVFAYAYVCQCICVCVEVEVGRVPGFVITKPLIHATN